MSDRPVEGSAMSDGAAAGSPPAAETAPPTAAASPARGLPPLPPMPAVPPYATPSAPAPPVGTAPTYPTTPSPPAPYGAPAEYGRVPQGYAPPPGYGPPQVYAAPQGYPPPQGYAPPQRFAPPPGYALPAQGYGPYTPQPPRAVPRGGSALGFVACVLAVLAALGATFVGSIAAYSIGLGTGQDIMLDPTAVDFDWSLLTPVRGWVLTAELAFWAGTILGIWALVQGIVATVKDRGRGWGIAALVIALIGPVAFAIGIQVFVAAGFAAGASVSG